MSISSGGATVDDDDGTWIVWGEVDVAVAQDVGDMLKASLDGHPKTIDLRRVTFLDSSGLRLLLLGGTAEEGPLLVGAPAAVRDVITLTGLEHTVRFAETEGSPDSGDDDA
ncbi:STAS domain-containing protein [Isoptericola sp. NPDC056605]|uniref:STAS domain-containing protein n=1 Tax=Isoptericola sp. NPDC056605 TaxID=3345876 RepID=UPI00369859BD